MLIACGSTVEGVAFAVDHFLVDRVLLHGEAERQFVGVGGEQVDIALDVHLKQILLPL